jgi:hypothetical protein
MWLRLNRRGATLPLTILVIAIMAVSIAITYSRLSSERRITGDSQAQLDAFAVAQSGLSQYVATRNGKPGPTQDTTFTTLPGGAALISLRMLRESTTTLLPAVYVITSRGTNTAAKRFDSRTPPAERTVATYALWTPAPLDVDGAITSLTGITLVGNSNNAHFSGIDHCGAQPAIPGIALPDPPNNFAGTNTAAIDGDPDNAPDDLGTPGPAGTAKDEVDIDWAGIVAGTYLTPNYVAPIWPPAGSPGFADWPILRVNNSGGPEYDLPGDGKGILIVTGDLKLAGNKTWDGLILVGGVFHAAGNNTVYGAVVSGLNVKLGQVVGASDIANGAKTYQYDSCALTRALAKIGSLERVRNGWTDTWPSY